MITFNDMLKGKSISDIPIAHQHNIEDLLKRVNHLLEEASKQEIGVFQTVTSGYRFLQDHLRIYRSKGIPDSKIPMGSNHLKGLAIDIFDPNLILTNWIKMNPVGISLAENLGLYFEDGNKNWVHAQCVPPKSGKRWFLP